MEEKPEVLETENKGGNKGLIAILVIIILCLGAYIAYDKLIVDKKADVNVSEKENKEVKPEEKSEEEKKEESKQDENVLTLFNKDFYISEACPYDKCDRKLGEFTLGGVKHEASVLMTEKHDNDSIIIDNKIKLTPKDDFHVELHKVVKIGEDYLGIGYGCGLDAGYEIEIYDKDFNKVKEYSSIDGTYHTEPIFDYFSVNGNSFTIYSCDTSTDDGSGAKQTLVTEQITINNGNFEQKEINRRTLYCSPN